MYFSFAGFRHSHVFSLLERIRSTDGAFLLGGWEPEPTARAAAEARGVECRYGSLEELLRDSRCQIVVVGAAYGQREEIILQALRAGKHVLSDKPFCTTQAGLEAIQAECARPGAPQLGCMFDLGTTPAMATAQKAVRDGRLGKLLAIQFNGMHPLNYRNGRPDWYFEPGMHGGTINDLASHAFDFIPQLSGTPIRAILFARAANIAFPECPAFQNTAQVAMELEGGAVASGDVSYAAPKASAFTLPSYWRFTVTGTLGWMEFRYGAPEVLLAQSGDSAPVVLPSAAPMEDYFDGFLAAVSGRETAFSSMRHLQTARWCLAAQRLADGR